MVALLRPPAVVIDEKDISKPMIPVRARRRSSQIPFVTWALMLVCVAVLVRLVLLPEDRAITIFEALAVVPSRLMATPLAPGQWLTLVTSAFLHAGWIHLVGNVLYLWVFGPLVEERLGWWRFLALYLGSGIAGALTFVATAPSSSSPLVGASAAIAGVLGAALVLEPRAEVTTVVPLVVWFELAELPAAFVIGLWFLLQIASAVAPVVAEAGATVAWIAHIGGFAAGALACVALTGRRIRKTARSGRAA